ncbi:uncharacterized protein tedc2 [Aulostomus maculatus]
MSLLSSVEEAIKRCKDEQARINDCIQVYREILKTLTSPPKTALIQSELAEDAATDTSPGETDDMKLLEQTLEKALQIRTGTGLSNKDPDRNKTSGSRKEAAASGFSSKEVTQPSAPFKGNHITTKSKARQGHKTPGASVSSRGDSRSSASSNPGQCKRTISRHIIQSHTVTSTGIRHRQAVKKSQHAVLTSDTHDHSDTSNKTAGSSVLRGENLGKASVRTTPPSNNMLPVSHTDDTAAHSLPQQNGIPYEQAAEWKSLKILQNRLWDKVMAVQRKPVSGRSHFMERMRAMFPEDLPRGSPDQTRSLVDRLIRQGHDLTHQCQSKEPLTQQTLERGLQMTAADLRNIADQVKHEWEVWDRWRPEGGCLSPAEAYDEVEDGLIAPLPLTITYTREAELRELEKLRMRVALLQQEIYLEQALSELLCPQLASIVPGCTNPSVLRDLYSLLGEGGQRFPAIVLDSEPD